MVDSLPFGGVSFRQWSVMRTVLCKRRLGLRHLGGSFAAGMLYMFTIGLGLGRQGIYCVAQLDIFKDPARHLGVQRISWTCIKAMSRE